MSHQRHVIQIPRKPPKPYRQTHWRTTVKSRLGREHPMYHPTAGDLDLRDWFRRLHRKMTADYLERLAAAMRVK